MPDKIIPNFDNCDILHIYGQGAWHDHAAIVGNRRGLERLKAVIEKALERGNCEASFFVNDGEGFDARVILVEQNEEINALAVPYTEDIAKEREGRGAKRWSQIEREKIRLEEADKKI